MSEQPPQNTSAGNSPLDRSEGNEVLHRAKIQLIHTKMDTLYNLIQENNSENEEIEAQYQKAQTEMSLAKEAEPLYQQEVALYAEVERTRLRAEQADINPWDDPEYASANTAWRSVYNSQEYADMISKHEQKFKSELGPLKEKVEEEQEKRWKMGDERYALWNETQGRKVNWDMPRSEAYNGSVNAFLDTVRVYQENKLQQKRAGIFGSLKELGVENDPKISARVESLLQQAGQRSERVAAKSRAWAGAFAVWIAAVAIGAATMHSKGNEKMEAYLGAKVDSLYAATSLTEEASKDSITNKYLEWIAQTKDITGDFQAFIQREDSAEFKTQVSGAGFISEKSGSTPRETENERKLMYLALEAMNKKYGNPEIVYGSLTGEGDHDRAFYSSGNNSIHVPTYAGKFKVEDYLAELSHAKQFSSDGAKYRAWHDKDYNKTLAEAKKSGKSYHDAQLNRYGDGTSLEHEAHSTIQPELEKELERKKQEIRDSLLK